jgi:AcrR family transcriptional regulator
MSRKDEIIVALIEIINEKGLSADFTISQLAKKVDIGKSTIYEYFDTKDEIFKEAIYTIFNESISSIMNREVDLDKTFETLFKDEMQFLFTLSDEKQYIMKMIQAEYKHNFPKLIKKELLEQFESLQHYYEERFRKIILKGFEENGFNSTNIIMDSLIISSLIAGSIQRYMNIRVPFPEDINIEDYIHEIYLTVLKIIQ